jgi:hypothetical protein
VCSPSDVELIVPSPRVGAGDEEKLREPGLLQQREVRENVPEEECRLRECEMQ